MSEEKEPPADDLAPASAESTPVEPTAAQSSSSQSGTQVPAPVTGPAPMPRGARLALQLLLPVVLSGAAVWIHWVLNVPDEISVSPRDQGAKGKKKKKKRKKKTKRKAATKAVGPRSDKVLARLEKRWAKRDLDDEPVIGDWARRHQTLLSKAFVVAKSHAFEGAPEEPTLTLATSKCHTVRCLVVVRSRFDHELDTFDATLSRMQAGDVPLWRTYEAEHVAAPADDPDGLRRLEVTVSFSADDLAPQTIGVMPPEPIEPVPASDKPSQPGSTPADDAPPPAAAAPRGQVGG